MDDLEKQKEQEAEQQAKRQKQRDARKKKMRKKIKREASDLDHAGRKANRIDKLKKNAGKYTKRAIFLGFLGFCGLVYYYATLPRTGTMAYGICRVFLERYVQFPTELRISTVQEFASSVRIWYIQTDSFGQYRMEPIQCYYKPDPQQGYILDKIEVRRREIPQEEVERFNKILPVIRASQPDLTIPKPIPDSLSNMQIDVFGYMNKRR